MCVCVCTALFGSLRGRVDILLSENVCYHTCSVPFRLIVISQPHAKTNDRATYQTFPPCKII